MAIELEVNVERKELKTKEDYKRYKAYLHEMMLQKQRVPYSIKRRMAETRIKDFYEEAQRRVRRLRVFNHWRAEDRMLNVRLRYSA